MKHVAAPAAVSAASVLSSRAVLARPSITVWEAHKFDRRATADVVNANAAESDAGRFNKRLVSRDHLKEVYSIRKEARDYHYERTLPWHDDGARILPSALYLDYAAAMRDRRDRFNAAVSAFLGSYPSAVADARRRLGSLFNAADYPDASEVARRFSFNVGIDPVPSGADFRVEIGDAVRADVERRVRETMASAMSDAVARMVKLVGTMATTLEGFKPAVYGDVIGDDGIARRGIVAPAEGIFRDSLVQNVRDLAAVLPAFNLSGSDAFDRLASRVAEVCKADPDKLRTDPALRRETAEAAAALAREADQIASDAAAWF